MHHRARYRYRFGDIDDAGIAYYPRFFHYFHCAFEDWWGDVLGVPYAKLLREHDLGFPVVRVESEFFAPIAYGDEPWVHLGVERVGRASVDFGFWMTLEGAEPEVRCAARITTVASSMAKREKRDVPDEWREAFARFQLEPGELPLGPRQSS